MATPKAGLGTKDETYWRVLDAAIELDFKKGHQRWTLSELSRTSGITRSLIYYYFGSKKGQILEGAVKFIGEEFFGLSEARLEYWRTGKVAESLIATRKLMERSPHMAAFYLVQRSAETEVGKGIRALEKQYVKKLQSFLPHVSQGAAVGVLGLFIGLVMAPGVPESFIVRAVQAALKEVNDPSAPPIT